MDHRMSSDSFEIELRGQVDEHLARWLGAFSVAHTADGNSRLTGTVADSAALYGVLDRCRDLGLILIRVNPVPEPAQGEKSMSKTRVEVSRVVDARPDDVLDVFKDYRGGHAAILPKPYFTGMDVVAGGYGAGTELHVYMKAMGVEKHYHQLVSEPEPGRVLAETDLDVALVTTFTVDPVDGGSRTLVTLTTVYEPARGLAGWFENLMTPPFMRKIYRQELENLAVYLAQPQASAALT